jgi:conjugal transfer pilus assembly protein TraB
MNESTSSPVIKKKQQRLLLGIAIVLLLGLFTLYSMLESHPNASQKKTKEEQLSMATPLNRVDAQSIWIERAQNQLAQEVKKSDGLQQQLQLLQQSRETQDKQTEQQSQLLQALQMQVADLQKRLSQQTTSDNLNQNSSLIRDEPLSLLPIKSANNIPSKNPNTFVSAGTFVRAIALGGADASAGVTSQGNPTPMLFRLLDEGTLPNGRKSLLKNCVATAAAIGDISSERGAVRLERLSCTRRNGEVIEIPVEATVFGPDGKDGIRGRPLWREGALLQRAFAAGALSGISDGIAQSYTSSSLNAWGGTTQTVDNGKILQYGAANGMSNAADKLADYNIKRAEQYHPVIQLSAGTVVDIVFLKGFYWNDPKDAAPDYLATPAPMAVTTPDSQMQNQEVASLPLTPQQIQALKQKNIQQGYF